MEEGQSWFQTEEGKGPWIYFSASSPLEPKSLNSLVSFLPRTLTFGRRSSREFKQELTFLQ